MESEQVVCAISNQETDDKLLNFTATTLNKIKLRLKIRKKYNLKFKDIARGI